MTHDLTPFQRRVIEAANLVKPPEILNLSEFADRYRVLSSETSAEPGPWRTDRFKAQREIMDAFTNPWYEKVVVVASSQIGKTEMVNNLMMYHIVHDPGPILFVHYSLAMAQRWSKVRFDPLLRDNKILHNLIADTATKNKDNTILEKRFPGGFLFSVGANSPGNLASLPIRILLLDEVDRYPDSAGTEGNPVKLAEERTKTFSNSKTILSSSPGNKETSKIWTEWEETDQKKWHVPCPHCGEYQEMVWDQVRWEEGKPETAYYECISCNEPVEEEKRYPMIQAGKWVAENPEVKNRPGFHLSELYSPFSPLSSLVKKFIEARKKQKEGDSTYMKVFKNTGLALPWESDIQSDIKTTQLLARCEDYQWSDRIYKLTGAVDVQDDRLETLILGWGEGEETWVIDYRQWYGNPAEESLWSEVAKYLLTPFHTLRVSSVGVDTGGHFTDEAYRFCKRYASRRFFAMKGSSTQGAPLTRKPTRNNKGNVKLFSIGTHTAKDLIFGRLVLKEPGPGYMHFSRDVCDEDYFEQLTAEVKVRLKTKKGIRLEYQKRTTHARNEVLDLTVYNLAAYRILAPKFKLKRDDSVIATEEAPAAAPKEEPIFNPKPKKENPFAMFDKRRKRWSI